MTGLPGLRWIPPLRLSGCWQMAIDELLLDRAVATSQARGNRSDIADGAVLRFYGWSRPTLSLGFHQHRLEPRWWELQARGELDLVRRPSGGRAVLHGDELTYALVWPGAPAQRRQAYRRACTWLQQGFADLGLPLSFGAESTAAQNPSCFGTSTAADLVEATGVKRIGSAQLWRRGVLLQHGSILLTPDRELWRQVLDEEPPALSPLDCSREELLTRLRQAALHHLPCASAGERITPLSAEEWSAIAARRQRYAVGSLRLTSPELSIERATGPSASPSG